MPTVQHSLLSGTELHEPKGADTATLGQHYLSDGAGSGAWTDIAKNSYTMSFPECNPFAGTPVNIRPGAAVPVSGTINIITIGAIQLPTLYETVYIRVNGVDKPDLRITSSDLTGDVAFKVTTVDNVVTAGDTLHWWGGLPVDEFTDKILTFYITET